MTARGEKRALFLDRDGVINHGRGYLYRISDIRFIDGIFAVAAEFAARGFAIVIATNQSGIGRGFFSEADFTAVMEWMKAQFAAQRAPVAAVYHCPYHPTAGVGAYRRDSDWRKPAPGMLLQAAAELGLDLDRSWSIGDQLRDIAAARAAGVGTRILFDADAAAVARREDYWIVPRLADVATLFRAEDGGSGRGRQPRLMEF